MFFPSPQLLQGPPSPHSPNPTFFLFLKKKKKNTTQNKQKTQNWNRQTKTKQIRKTKIHKQNKKHTEIPCLLGWPTLLFLHLPWSVVDKPSNSPLEKSDSPFLSSYRFKFLVRSGTLCPLPFQCWLLPSWSCAGVASAVIVSGCICASVPSGLKDLTVLIETPHLCLIAPKTFALHTLPGCGTLHYFPATARSFSGGGGARRWSTDTTEHRLAILLLSSLSRMTAPCFPPDPWPISSQATLLLGLIFSLMKRDLYPLFKKMLVTPMWRFV